MDIKDTVATFQLKGTRIVDFNIQNDFIDLPGNDELNKSINLGNPSIKIDDNKDNENDMLFAELQLKANILYEHKELPQKLNISITVEGFFSFSEKSEDKFKQMLCLNGNSNLYTVIRSYVTTISSLALNSGKIIMPMINFLKLADLLAKKNDENNNMENSDK